MPFAPISSATSRSIGRSSPSMVTPVVSAATGPGAPEPGAQSPCRWRPANTSQSGIAPRMAGACRRKSGTWMPSCQKAGCPRSPSTENHAALAVEQDAPLGMPAHRARQHDRFEITSDLLEALGCVLMTHSLHRLLDDRTLVEIGRDVVRGGADDLHAAFVSLVVRPCALEARQERMMNVDAASGERAAHVIRQDLHVTRQHQKVRLVA